MNFINIRQIVIGPSDMHNEYDAALDPYHEGWRIFGVTTSKKTKFVELTFYSTCNANISGIEFFSHTVLQGKKSDNGSNALY